MKLFKEGGEQPSKQWSIKVDQDGHTVRIDAVDSKTGIFVAALLVFTPECGLVAKDKAGEMLNSRGYDTHQNGNSFNSDTGNIWVRNEGEIE